MKKPLVIAKKGAIRPGVIAGRKRARAGRGCLANIVYRAIDPEVQGKLKALKTLEGIWADKDTSFFEKKHE